MIAAQPSVGKAATWPTIGTILMAAEATRHGAASTPQPLKPETSNSMEVLIRKFLIDLKDTGNLVERMKGERLKGRNGAENLVRLAGIEPATLGFGGQYSIH